jgi:hypothetical protein
MLYNRTDNYQLTGYYGTRRQSFIRSVVSRCMDLLKHLVLLGTFLLFISFIQVATANQVNTQKEISGTIQLEHQYRTLISVGD